MAKISCTHFPRCTGCQFIGEEDTVQKETKIAQLSSLIQTFDLPPKELGWLSAGISGLRDRLDFVWENGQLGLYSNLEKKIIGIDFCSQLSPALNDWYQEFKKIQWPIKKGSIRLRVGPQGLKGAWLDFANLDIKMLLDEKTVLISLLKTGAVVEIGQKRKILKIEQDLLKLKDPESHLWFESLFQNQKVALFCHIASFTQPSMKANFLIVQQIQNWVSQSGLSKASEFGAGIGNLSLALLGQVESLRIFESDALSLECLKQTLDQSRELQNQFSKINFQVGDHQQKKKIEFERQEVLVVNPPRSGLMGFLETLKDSSEKPSELIYLSCSPTTWSTDGQKLKALGYQLKETFIVDQFPQTQHYEILSRWLS